LKQENKPNLISIPRRELTIFSLETH